MFVPNDITCMPTVLATNTRRLKYMVCGNEIISPAHSYFATSITIITTPTTTITVTTTTDISGSSTSIESANKSSEPTRTHNSRNGEGITFGCGRRFLRSARCQHTRHAVG